MAHTYSTGSRPRKENPAVWVHRLILAAASRCVGVRDIEGP
jgi:hypothetical protein